MKKFLYGALLSSIILFALAQSASASVATYQWTQTHGGSSWDTTYDTAVDTSGNVYAVGRFKGTVDFDPSGSTDNHTSAGSAYNVFVTKRTADGTYAWTNTFGNSTSTSAYELDVDSSGNVYVVGDFNGTVDFDPSGSTDNKVSSNTDMFITKYDTDGTYAWTKTFGSTSSDKAFGIVVDSNDDLIVSGEWGGTVDFDPDAGTQNKISGTDSVFVAKYSSAGAYIDFMQLDSDEAIYANVMDIDVDSSDNILITGSFEGTVDFDPGGGTSNITAEAFSQSTYIGKYDSNLDLVWIKSISSSGNNLKGFAIAVDSTDDVYSTGTFADTADLDPSGGTDSHTSNGGDDIYIQKLESDGTFAWAKTFGSSSSEEVYSIDTDSADNVYTFVTYYETTDFDTGAATDSRVTTSDGYMALTQHTSDGVYISTITGDGSNTGYSDSVIFGSAGFYISGAFDGSFDFDPGASTDSKTSNGSGDIFLSYYTYSTDATAPTFSSVSATGTSDGATVTWTSNEAASSQIEYGLTTSYGTTTTETDTSTRVTSHSQTITGLPSCTTYHYRVKGSDAATNTGTGSDGTFTTAGCTGSASVQATSTTSSTVSTGTGGTVTHTESSTTKVTLTVPASYAGSAANFQVHRLASSSVTGTAPVRAGYTIAGSNTYALSAYTGVATQLTSFTNPITVTMYYTDNDVSNIVESTLLIHRWSGTEWQALSGCTIDTTANTVACTTTNFSTFALFGRGTSSGGSSGPSDRPDEPDLNAMDGGVLEQHEITAIIDPGTLDFNTDLSVNIVPQTYTLPQNMRFYSSVYHVEYLNHFNKAGIIPDLQAKDSILAIHYTRESLGLSALMNIPNLKLAYSPDLVQWTILPTSVHDSFNKTVAALTKPYGYYAIVSGGGYTASINPIHTVTSPVVKTKPQDTQQKIDEKKEIPSSESTDKKMESHDTPDTNSPQVESESQGFFSRIWSTVTGLFR